MVVSQFNFSVSSNMFQTKDVRSKPLDQKNNMYPIQFYCLTTIDCRDSHLVALIIPITWVLPLDTATFDSEG